jgi:hypothetical protein
MGSPSRVKFIGKIGLKHMITLYYLHTVLIDLDELRLAQEFVKTWEY